ncbi:ATP-dependent RNA helicase DDX60 [Pancytospora epiphaga]|nr:ATP-dependent RNA helicase DDX60 [Pancytospora epiphaga]
MATEEATTEISANEINSAGNKVEQQSSNPDNVTFTNITTTFTGIGYTTIDINGVIEDAISRYSLVLEQLPTTTILAHLNYLIQNLQQASLQDLRFYYEYTGNPWMDLIILTIDDGSFISFTEISRAVEEDRMALLLTSTGRKGVVEYCSMVGLHVGYFDSLLFVYPYASCDIASPSTSLSYDNLCYTVSQVDYTLSEIGSNDNNGYIVEYLNKKGFTVDSMNDQFFENTKEYVFDELKDGIDLLSVKALLKYNQEKVKLFFDGRIFYGYRKIATINNKIDRSIFESIPTIPWNGRDLDLIMPPIPEKQNLKHLANIRRSALSMYERAFQYSTIPDSKKGKEAPKKISAKMQKIMDENTARIRAEKEKTANSWLRNFYSNYSKLSGITAKRAYVESIKIDNNYINNKLSLLKIEIYMDLWSLEQRSATIDEKVLVPLYLACLNYIERNCFLKGSTSNSKESCDLAELEFVLAKMAEAGFEATVHEIMEKYDIPKMNIPFKTKATALPNDIDLYFQLKYAGDQLKRTLGTRKDSRVPFDPDLWQTQLLDAIDSNKSAIVAAPTSSGKTFICFYAIEKVIRSSDTDVVIFCLPTKALANQVSADIYARFNPKNCKMVLQGTLMADRCSEPFNCQVLITIPCMLESLLASRECKNIKYIIIDEVHKINDESIGLSIERTIHLARCPLLLLSATIGNITEFYAWFSSIEESKGREHALVTHNERFCELKPYLYAGDMGTSALEKGIEALSFNKDEEGENPGRSPLVPLNCMVAYSFSHLKEFGFGNDITFLPEELLNLYYYIYMVLDKSQKNLIKRLAPKKFFKSNIICKADTREYQRHLLSTFEGWVQEGILSEEQVREVYNLLVGDTLSLFPVVCNEEYLMSNMVGLLLKLREQDMLPVIVFNMDREFVTRLAKAVYLELESQDMRRKKDKMVEKIKKENKRMRDVEKTKDSWIEESIASEQSFEPEIRDIKCTFLDQLTRLSDAEVKEELSEVRGTPKFAIDMVYRGIGIHHAGMERRYRSAVEILFRKKHVRVLFATETLALGINMPCRTVVFAGDSLALDPMNYKQMAGRAGRRGYDTLGNVVFMGIPRNRVQNLMVSMLPRIQGSYTFSNTSLISFKIEKSLIENPLLGSNSGLLTAGASEQNKVVNASDYCFGHLKTKEIRKELVECQKMAYPFLSTPNYLWDLFISNRCEDPSIFIFGLMFHMNVIPWDQHGFISLVAHLFEARPCASATVLEPLQGEPAQFLKKINDLYRQEIRRFYTPQLRTLSNMSSKPLYYINSFLYTLECPKNSYIYDFYQHGSSGRIAIRNQISCGDLWQSLYNIDYALSSFIALIENYHGDSDERLRPLRLIYSKLHDKFKNIFA